MYDIRVASGVQNYNEEEIPKCVQAVAEKIAKSMTRLYCAYHIIILYHGHQQNLMLAESMHACGPVL